jgi:hypothetical protein
MPETTPLPSAPAAEAGADGVPTLRDRLDLCQDELARVRRSLGEAQAAGAGLAGEVAALQQESAALARLHVACLALHGTLNRDRVLAAVEDLLINLAATEEFGVYALPDGTAQAELVSGFGIDQALRARLVPRGVVARAVETGETCLEEGCFEAREPGGGAGQPVACIPLRVDGRTTGAVAVWSFLPQKPGPEPGDPELYALLSTHVAVALHAVSA